MQGKGGGRVATGSDSIEVRLESIECKVKEEGRVATGRRWRRCTVPQLLVYRGLPHDGACVPMQCSGYTANPDIGDAGQTAAATSTNASNASNARTPPLLDGVGVIVLESGN